MKFNNSPNGDGRDPPPRQLVDVENLNKRRSLERMQHRLDMLNETLDYMIGSKVEPGINDVDVLNAYRLAIEAAIGSFRPLIENEGREYWAERPLGKLQPEIPTALKEKSHIRGASNDFEIFERPDKPDPIVWRGLRDLAQSDNFVSRDLKVSFREFPSPSKLKDALPDNAEVLETGEKRLSEATIRLYYPTPKRVLDEARVALQEFARDIGLDAGLEDNKDPLEV